MKNDLYDSSNKIVNHFIWKYVHCYVYKSISIPALTLKKC